MKYFTLFIFLILAVALKAQAVNEVTFVPSPSGYYNNLIVKNNTNINTLVTDLFNVQSYGSILNINVSSNSKLFINTLSVTNPFASIVLMSNISDSGYSNSSVTAPANPPLDRAMPDPPPQQEATSLPRHNIKMYGGNLSVSKARNAPDSVQMSIQKFVISSRATSPELNIKVHDMYSVYSNNELKVNNLYILGMRVPNCQGNYYWKGVRVGSATYTVLACDTSGSISAPEVPVQN